MTRFTLIVADGSWTAVASVTGPRGCRRRAPYASFQHLLALEASIVKLDMSLTRGIDTDPVRRALAEALVGFSRDMGTELIAEGVETSNELEVLRSLGIRFVQGFHLGRPVALNELVSAHRLHRAR